MVVELRLPAAADPERLEGLDVVATGRLEQQRLVIDGLTSLTPRPGGRRATPIACDSPAGAELSHHDLPLRPDAERTLIDDGALLTTWQPTQARYVALPTDVDRVRDALTPLYPASLDVVQSRWTTQTLQEILDALADSDLGYAQGYETGPEDQLKVTATLLHPPTTLARRLTSFPADALALDVLLKPVATGGRSR
jgi:hypothetical protein